MILAVLAILTLSVAAGVKAGAAGTNMNVVTRTAAEDDDKGCGGEAEFYGTIETLPSTSGFIGDWKVSGRTVRVSTATRIDGSRAAIAVGAQVEVEGCPQNDGSIVAEEIEIKTERGRQEFKGLVEMLPDTTGRLGDWKVSGVIVHVTSMTYIDQSKMMVAIGSKVEIEGPRRADGSIDATKIEVTADLDRNQNEFRGTVESLPDTAGRIGVWSVSGRKINVTASTRIKPDAMSVAVGNIVQIKGAVQMDGSVNATDIEVKFNYGDGGNFAEFYGTIEMLPGTPNQIGVWTVSGRKVNVTANTLITPKGQGQGAPQIAIGARVEVKGPLQADGSINAVKIKLKKRDEFEFFGKIEMLPASTDLVGDWKVAGRTVRVTAMTEINRKYGMVVVGAYVEVEGTLQSDGSVNAREIEVKQGDANGAFMNYAAATSVSAASYGDDNAPESIVAAFGNKIAPGAMVASTLPLPTTLNNVSVLIDGRQARLFVVTPSQINYQIPTDTPAGAASVVITINRQIVSQGSVNVSRVAPSIFTANASGQDVPAGAVLRIRSNGQQVFEPLARFDATAKKFVAVPVVRRAGEQLFLILFGTGLKQAANSDGNAANGAAENVQATIGGVNAPVAFAGVAPGFAGLEQLNIRIPDNAPAGQAVQILIGVRDRLNVLKQANPVSISLQ
jgi:uncharacterized protein (TIGR03437 family)